MDLKSLQTNQRLQIDVEVDLKMDTHRGIIMKTNEEGIYLITDFGEMLVINKRDILSIKKISFDRYVSNAILDIKTHYEEKMGLEEKAKELVEREKALKEALLDANVVSRYNIAGARNRLEKSIESNLLNFERGEYLYEIYFSCNPNDEIEVNFDVYYSLKLDIKGYIDMDEVIKNYAPNELDVIKVSFPRVGRVKELRRTAVHENENNYCIRSSYMMRIPVDKKNFLERRENIITGLNNLRM